MDQKSSILIVDDDEGIRRSLSLIFDKKGYEIDLATTGREAIAKAQERFYNAALLDVRLSDMEGIDLLQLLKEMHPDMILFVVTGYASLKTAMRALNNGAAGYLTKPVDVNELLARINDHLEMQHLRMENVRLYSELQQELAERKRVEEDIHRHHRELTLLNQIIAASAAKLDTAAILEITCRELALAFNIPHAAAVLLNEKKTWAHLVSEYRQHDQLSMRNLRIRVKNNPIAQHILTNRTPVPIDDVAEDPRMAIFANVLKQRGIVSMLVVPLVIDQAVVGGLMLSTVETHHFSVDEVNLAWSVAEQVSGVLGRARLVQNYQRLFTAIEQTADSVVITNTKGRILYVNPAFKQTAGYTQTEIIGRNPRILKSGKHDTNFYKDLWDTISAGQMWHGRFINKKKDGTLYTEEANISPVRDENGEIVNYVAVKRDVTRELELEAQYLQSQKMEMLGQLTGGIAHDFNNLLTAVIGFAELTQMRSSPDDPSRKLLDKILYSGRRASDLVAQLMAFSRKQVIEPKVLNLNGIVIDIEKMLHRIIGETIAMKTRLAPDLWLIKVDRTQIDQVIVNLAVNARDAMPNGGRLTIETTNVILDEAYAAANMDVQPGEYVVLSVRDTGVGMSQEVIEHIFEPFFTTKEKGKGSGLGLATVFGIVKQSEGHIQVESVESQGTIFKVYVPRIAGTNVPAAGQKDEQGDLPLGKETLLLVEDEPAVREMASFALRQQGYTVLDASSGPEALQLIKTHNGEIQLLITDVVMPQMNGKELADQIQAMRPHTRVLFTSGYTDDTIVQHGVLKPDIAFLPKPFSPSALAFKVRQTLDNPHPSPPG